jgi:hypothetical protein
LKFKTISAETEAISSARDVGGITALSVFAISYANPPLPSLAVAAQAMHTGRGPVRIPKELVMKIQVRSLMFGLFAAAASAVAAPVYVEGQSPVYTPGQYGAVLDQSSQQWRVQPLVGEHVTMTNRDPSCLSSAVLANGLWVIGRDAQGRFELVAASDTTLPSGAVGAIALRSCDDPIEGLSVRVPPQVMSALTRYVGAVLIDG